jgi:putative endonuclease
VSEHNEGVYGGYTSTRRPVTLVWAEHFLNITDAIAVERQIKGWSRAKKEALIRGDYDAIQRSQNVAARPPPIATLRDAPFGRSSGEVVVLLASQATCLS